MKEHEKIMSAIALIVVVSFCTFAVYVGLWTVPLPNQHYVDIALGALVAAFSTVLSYYFGSSRSAEKKVPPTEEQK